MSNPSYRPEGYETDRCTVACLPYCDLPRDECEECWLQDKGRYFSDEELTAMDSAVAAKDAEIARLEKDLNNLAGGKWTQTEINAAKWEGQEAWIMLNGLDIEDAEKRADNVIYQMLEGCRVGDENRASVKRYLVDHFKAVEAKAKDKAEQRIRELEERNEEADKAFHRGAIEGYIDGKEDVREHYEKILQEQRENSVWPKGIFKPDPRDAVVAAARELKKYMDMPAWEAFDARECYQKAYQRLDNALAALDAEGGR